VLEPAGSRRAKAAGAGMGQPPKLTKCQRRVVLAGLDRGEETLIVDRALLCPQPYDHFANQGAVRGGLAGRRAGRFGPLAASVIASA
jgi:hypothetical protein